MCNKCLSPLLVALFINSVLHNEAASFCHALSRDAWDSVLILWPAIHLEFIAMAWFKPCSAAVVINLFLTCFMGLPLLHCTKIMTFSLGGDPVSPSLWNKMFHTIVPYASPFSGQANQRTHCTVSCMLQSSAELPCNTFIIHDGACYLGDVNGSHTFIPTGAVGTDMAITMYSNHSQGIP